MNSQELEDELKKVNVPISLTWEDVPHIKTVPVISNILALAIRYFFKNDLSYNIFMILSGSRATVDESSFRRRQGVLWEKRMKLLKNRKRNTNKLIALFHGTFWECSDGPFSTSFSLDPSISHRGDASSSPSPDALIIIESELPEQTSLSCEGTTTAPVQRLFPKKTPLSSSTYPASATEKESELPEQTSLPSSSPEPSTGPAHRLSKKISASVTTTALACTTIRESALPEQESISCQGTKTAPVQKLIPQKISSSISSPNCLTFNKSESPKQTSLSRRQSILFPQETSSSSFSSSSSSSTSELQEPPSSFQEPSTDPAHRSFSEKTFSFSLTNPAVSKNIKPELPEQTSLSCQSTTAPVQRSSSTSTTCYQKIKSELSEHVSISCQATTTTSVKRSSPSSSTTAYRKIKTELPEQTSMSCHAPTTPPDQRLMSQNISSLTSCPDSLTINKPGLHKQSLFPSCQRLTIGPVKSWIPLKISLSSSSSSLAYSKIKESELSEQSSVSCQGTVPVQRLFPQKTSSATSASSASAVITKSGLPGQQYLNSSSPGPTTVSVHKLFPKRNSQCSLSLTTVNPVSETLNSGIPPHEKFPISSTTIPKRGLPPQLSSSVLSSSSSAAAYTASLAINTTDMPSFLSSFCPEAAVGPTQRSSSTFSPESVTINESGFFETLSSSSPPDPSTFPKWELPPELSSSLSTSSTCPDFRTSTTSGLMPPDTSKRLPLLKATESSSSSSSSPPSTSELPLPKTSSFPSIYVPTHQHPLIYKLKEAQSFASPLIVAAAKTELLPKKTSSLSSSSSFAEATTNQSTVFLPRKIISSTTSAKSPLPEEPEIKKAKSVSWESNQSTKYSSDLITESIAKECLLERMKCSSTIPSSSLSSSSSCSDAMLYKHRGKLDQKVPQETAMKMMKSMSWESSPATISSSDPKTGSNAKECLLERQNCSATSSSPITCSSCPDILTYKHKGLLSWRVSSAGSSTVSTFSSSPYNTCITTSKLLPEQTSAASASEKATATATTVTVSTSTSDPYSMIKSQKLELKQASTLSSEKASASLSVRVTSETATVFSSNLSSTSSSSCPYTTISTESELSLQKTISSPSKSATQSAPSSSSLSSTASAASASSSSEISTSSSVLASIGLSYTTTITKSELHPEKTSALSSASISASSSTASVSASSSASSSIYFPPLTHIKKLPDQNISTPFSTVFPPHTGLTRKQTSSSSAGSLTGHVPLKNINSGWAQHKPPTSRCSTSATMNNKGLMSQTASTSSICAFCPNPSTFGTTRLLPKIPSASLKMSSTHRLFYSKAVQTTQDIVLRRAKVCIRKKNIYIERLKNDVKEEKYKNKRLETSKKRILSIKRDLKLKYLEAQKQLRKVQKQLKEAKRFNLRHSHLRPEDKLLWDASKRTYVPECEECVLTLKKLGVPNSKVTGAIEACLKMVNVGYERLPQKTYVNKVTKAHSNKLLPVPSDSQTAESLDVVIDDLQSTTPIKSLKVMSGSSSSESVSSEGREVTMDHLPSTSIKSLQLPSGSSSSESVSLESCEVTLDHLPSTSPVKSLKLSPSGSPTSESVSSESCEVTLDNLPSETNSSDQL